MATSPTTVQFPDDPMQYEVVTWDQLTNLIFLVAQKITADNLHFDRIVSLAKGGWPMARTLADFLKVREASSIGTRSYTGIGERATKLEVYQDLHEIKGEKLLLLDDVSDTGKTLEFALEYLQKRGADSVSTATVYYKPHSIFKPNYFAKETSSWIIFPYEIIETSILLHDRWQKNSLPLKEITKRLGSIGCSPEWQKFLSIT
jgi:hypothetical protein